MTKSKKSLLTQSRVIAVDPGIDRIGIAVLEKIGGKEKVLFSECLKTNPKESQSKRLLQIGSRLRGVIEKWEPRSLAIETLFFNQNTTSAIHVAEARGVILYECEKSGLEVFEYAPQAIKIAVTGYGKADKIQVRDMVRRLVALPENTAKIDDEIDAIALGITHLASQKGI